MKNYEKYAEEIKEKEFEGTSFCKDFVIPHILKSKECCNNCPACRMRQMAWLLEEYEEPETDWSKVEVDTPILVSDSGEGYWNKRHFAKYENGNIYAWRDGFTSWTTRSKPDWSVWKYAKLAESEESDE